LPDTSANIFERIDTRPDVAVQDSEYKRLLGYPPGHLLEGRAMELATQTREWYNQNGKPWIYARHTDQVEVQDGKVIIERNVFSSTTLAKKLRQASADSVVLAAVCAGKNCEEAAQELWRQEKPDEYFFLEVYGSAVVEHLVTSTGYQLCAWGDKNMLAVLPHWSPGYPGWTIGDQELLLSLIFRDSTRPFPEAISVLDTGMLRPKKSLLAVFGLTRQLESVRRLSELIPCESCPMPSCQYRRTPYQRSGPSLEDVRLLQPKPLNFAVVPPSSPYSLNPRALRKWSQERLRLDILQDRSIKARFHLEGTTCSNMGMPLHFDYHVRLSSPEREYRILEANCVPAPGDTGHTRMCEYIENSDSLMDAISAEKPLLGRPLKEVFAWRRSNDPAGCYCTRTGRDHKWGIVLEVLHYALANNSRTEP
jgi:hypothetical protein